MGAFPVPDQGGGRWGRSAMVLGGLGERRRSGLGRRVSRAGDDGVGGRVL